MAPYFSTKFVGGHEFCTPLAPVDGDGRATPRLVVHVRSFQPGDQGAVRDLVLAGLAERWGPSFDPAHNPDLDDLAASYLSQGAEIVVAVDDSGSIVATGTLVPETDRRGRLVRVSVDGGRRGEGLGRAVVEELMRRARRRGLRSVVVSTDTPWTSALALYRACGLTELGRDDVETHLGLSW